MKLPRGVTGFGRGRRPPVLPQTDLRAFRTHCHAAARAAGGAVLGFEDPYRFCNNFAEAALRLPAGPVAVLLNAHFPLIGLARPGAARSLEVEFVDAPELADVLRGFGVYEVLDRAALEQPPTAAMVADLPAWERPEPLTRLRLGDLVFNTRD